VSGLLALCWVVGFTEMRDVVSSMVGNLGLLRDRPVLAGGTGLILAGLFWLAWVPPHFYDALVYHLPLAAAYAREGRVFPVEHLLFTHFPQNGEMLYTLALLLGSETLAQLFTWLGTFLSVWWLFEMGKRQLPITAVLLACLMTVTHTAVMLLTPIAYVECLVMLWVTACMLSFLRWWTGVEEEGAPRAWLMLAGFFAGIGVGTKYYAGICPAFLALVLACRWLKSKPWLGGAVPRDRLKDSSAFCVAAFLAGVPWLIKNIYFVGDPVFPFLYDRFPLRGVEWVASSAQRYFEIMTEYGHSRGSFLKDLVQFPYLAATGSTRFGGGADVLGDLGWAPLAFLAPVAVAWAWRKRYLRWMLLYCVVHWFVWFQTGVVLRFLVVLVPMLSLLAAYGLHQLWQALGGFGRTCLAAGAGLLLWTNLALFLYVHTLVDSVPVLVGVKTRTQFLSEKLDYFPCAAYARERLGPNDKILLFGEQRGYYVEQPHVATTVMAPNRFVRMANAAADPADLAGRLKTEGGFRYALVAPREAQRLDEGYGVFHFTEKGYQNWAGLETGHSERVFESPGRCAVYRFL